MKLRKNDYTTLRAGGQKAVAAKLIELADDYTKTKVLKMKNELKNLRALSSIRRAIATLKTISAELKGAK